MTRIGSGRGSEPHIPSPSTETGDRDRGALDAGLSRFGMMRGNADSGFETHRDCREDAGGRHERESLFSERLRQALNSQQDGGRKDEQSPDQFTGLRLLVTALPAEHIGSGDQSDGPRASPHTRAEAVAARVAAALDAAERPLPGAPLVLTLQMPELADAGIAGLMLVMTGDQLDIALTTSGGPLPESLREAAQVLADRLNQRFPNRRIRIFEGHVEYADGDPETSQTGSMSQISALLSR
ncbi:MAG: hypothetical protein ACOH2J_16725 [Allorhizobium sp.]